MLEETALQKPAVSKYEAFFALSTAGIAQSGRPRPDLQLILIWHNYAQLLSFQAHAATVSNLYHAIQ